MKHAVKDGEGISTLADRYGFFPDTIWDHPENAELKETRHRPNTLLPGDQVFIPDKVPKTVNKPVDAVHTFRRRGVPARYRLKLMSFGEPQKHVPFTFRAGGAVVEGETDGDGILDVPVRASVKSARLEVGKGDDVTTYEITFWTLRPVTNIAGVQQRLRNLNLYDGELSGQLDEATKDAIWAFQTRVGIEPTGDLDDATRARLEDLHDSKRAYDPPAE